MAADVSPTRLYLGNLPRDGTQTYTSTSILVTRMFCIMLWPLLG